MTIKLKQINWQNLMIVVLYKASIILALEMGIGCVLSFFAGYYYAIYFNLPLPRADALWCVIATILILQATSSHSLKVGIDRVIGSLVGTLFAATLISLFGTSLWVFFIACIAVVIFCSSISRHDSLRVAVLTAAIIFILRNDTGPTNYWLQSLDRLIESLFGIVIALGIMLSAKHLRKSVRLAYEQRPKK